MRGGWLGGRSNARAENREGELVEVGESSCREGRTNPISA